MKGARLLVLGVAIFAGGAAALLSQRSSQPETVVVERPAAPTVATVQVLVASGDIGMGTVIAPGNLAWQEWPRDAASGLMTRGDGDDPMTAVIGSIARQPFVSGEPIRDGKIIKADGSGFMSAILPAGFRAIATEISAETGAGGFVLPNDRVDVIVTRQQADQQSGRDRYVSSTILRNVRVLAIDQAIEEQGGKKVVVGRTATLELFPEQAEQLALARQLGTISLSLRSLADANPSGLAGSATPEFGDSLDASGPSGDGINIVRYGVSTRIAQ